MSILETQKLSFLNESNATTIELLDKLIEYIRILVKKIYDLAPTTVIEYRDGNENILMPIDQFLSIMKQTIEQVENKKQIMENNKIKIYEILNCQHENENKQTQVNQQYYYQIDQYPMSFESYSTEIVNNNADKRNQNILLLLYYFISSYGSYEIEKISHEQVQEQIVILLNELKFCQFTDLFLNSIK